MDIQIDDEFEKLVRPLNADEYRDLEAQILEQGCLFPLLLWGDILVDGHHRYQICMAHDVPFNTKQIDFESRYDVKYAIRKWSTGRRNITQAERADLAIMAKSDMLAKGRERMLGNQNASKDKNTLSTVDKPFSEEVHNTQNQLAADFGLSKGTLARAEQAMENAPEVWELAKQDKATINEVYRAGKLEPEQQAEIVRQVADGESKTVNEAIKKIAHVGHNSGNNEWYTPSEYIEAARMVMGAIDLDPASCARANEVVDAGEYYTEEDNGLTQEWGGRVWMNPPYAQPAMGDFARKLLEEVKAGRVTEAVILVNNATETGWANDLVEASSAVCFPKGRVRFWAPDGIGRSAPLQGQAVYYAGKNPSGFMRQFSQFGWCAKIEVA